MGHRSVAFTMDQYADAWPEALSSAGEKAAGCCYHQVVAKREQAGAKCSGRRASVATFWPFARHGTRLKSTEIP
jgi:hypothetical protein